MMGQQTHTESLFYYFRLEDQIPEDHLLRLIDRHIDFSFVRKQVKEFYSPTGRPSIDPEVLLRLLRSARYYEKIFGARILTMGDGNAPPYLQLANIWMILNVGGGPTPDKPTVTLRVPDPNHINSFMNFRVADIQACYELWKSRGAEFLTEPIAKYGEIRCYIRDPDGYIIEVGQSTALKYG